MARRARFAVLIVLVAASAGPAAQMPIAFLSDIALDQPRVAVYLRSPAGILPIGTEGYAIPGLLDTGAAAHVLPAYLAGPDGLSVPIDPAGEAEVLTLCGYTEFLDITQPLWVGAGPWEDAENQDAYVETSGPHRIAVRLVDAPGADLLMFPMILGTPFFLDYAIRVEWQLIEIFPGFELPQLVTELLPAGQPSGQPVDLTIPLTLAGEVSLDPVPPLPTAYSVPFMDVVLHKGAHRQRRALLVDTGAQITFISSDLAVALGVDLSSPDGPGLPVAGAGSCTNITLYPYFLDQMIMPTKQGVALAFEQPLVYVLDVPGIDGGIGSNTLFFFEEIDAVEIDVAARRIGMKLNVPIPPSGDTDGNGRVDVFDVIAVVVAFGAQPGQPAYNERADINLNDVVDVFDVIAVVVQFGTGG